MEEKIRLHYPLPIAKLFESMLLEDEARQRTRKLVELFERTAQYLVLVGLASYTHYQLFDPQVENLRPDLTRPSLGHWIGLLKTISNALQSRDPGFLTATPNYAYKDEPISNAVQVLNQITRSQPPKKVKLNNFLDTIVEFRNKKLGHGSLSVAEAKNANPLLESALNQWLESLSVLYERRLLYIARVEWQAPHFVYIGTNLNSGTSYKPLTLQGNKAINHKQVYLHVPTTSELIALNPLFVYNSDTYVLYVYGELSNQNKPLLKCLYEAPGVDASLSLDIDSSVIVGTHTHPIDHTQPEFDEIPQKLKTTEETPIDQRDRLQELDAVIQVSREGKQLEGQGKDSKKLALRALLLVAGSVIDTNSDVNKAALDMLDSHRGLASGKLVAVCLLRLLAEPNMGWLTENPWRPKVAALLDSQFSEDFYKEWRVDVNAMGHEKLDRLIQVVKEIDDKFYQAAQMLTSLERIKVQRQQLMQVIHQRANQTIILPFLLEDISSRLGELYTRVNAYIDERDSLQVLEVFESAIGEIDRFIQLTKTKNTIYSNVLASQVGEQLLLLIKKDFTDNKVAKPATVLVRVRDKKYPFHLVNHTIMIGLIVENDGPGYAHETNLIIVGDSNFHLLKDQVNVGRLAPATSQPIDIPVKVVKNSNKFDFMVEVNWRDFDGQEKSNAFELSTEAQKSTIDWDRVALTDPYSLEPVSSEQELVGRKEVLNLLIRKMKGDSASSSIIYGQKRVGKTSIAKALESFLRASGDLVVYLEGGDYVDPTPKVTISRLGNKLCTRIKKSEARIADIKIPSFDEALSPLTDFLDEITEIIPERRIVFILDEFDELPLALYQRGSLGNAFFLTLRSITSRPNIGFVLVGGEKMTHIIDNQGSQLNKWIPIPVDYFEKTSDYRELIQRPVGDSLEFTEEAITTLHEATGGNPYFTKLICNYIFQMAIQKRDCYITRQEVEQAIEIAIGGEVDKTVEAAVGKIDKNTFQHFWEDGIFETGDRATEKSVRRRKILIILSDILNSRTLATSQGVSNHPIVRNIGDAVESELKEFTTRKVLVYDMQSDSYDFKVDLFRRWLKNRGIHEIISTFSDLDAGLRARQAEEEEKARARQIELEEKARVQRIEEARKVQLEKIVELVEQWGPYKGHPITVEQVQMWLEQFGEFHDQEIMFKILQALRFYSHKVIHEKMREIDVIVKRGVTQYLQSDKRKRSEIVVSYIEDGLGKSAVQIARLYADDAKIYTENIVKKSDLPEVLRETPGVQALVFFDDFVGTSQLAVKFLEEIANKLKFVIRDRKIKVVFVTISAYIEGWSLIEERVKTLDIPIQIHACEILGESRKCFSEKSLIFTDPVERDLAREIAFTYGKALEPKFPLGYGDLELAVVFENGCPNNSLPILWSESKGEVDWKPLFKRL
ncbi:MAG: hypothetical protein DPW09_11165 [Anaerolineae bacterium]|nr:hypothetical protein [Anaerolineae bacterium]